MEKFEIVEKENCDMIFCRKRKLEIQVIHTDHVPCNLPKDALIVFASDVERAFGEPLNEPGNLVSAFCICNADKIEYELFLIENLISNAIVYYAHYILGLKYNKFEYSPGFQETYIDSRPLDPTKIKPELLAYITRDNLNDGLDFYEWKAQYLPSLLN